MKKTIIRHLIYPAYKFTGKGDVIARLKELKRNQRMTTDELRELQWRKLKTMVDYVYKNIPYYEQLFNDMGLKPKDIQNPADFRKLPVLTKAIIRNKADMMITIDRSKKGVGANTGGSTGETLYFYKDMEAGAYTRANLIRLYEWCGIKFGDKEATFWGTPFDYSTAQKATERIKEYVKNLIQFSTFDMSEQALSKYVKTIYKTKPCFLSGYPSALFTFANFLKKNNISDIRPKAVISTGEKTFPFQRELMEEVFGNVIYERYGSNEFGNIAHECAEHKGVHLITDLFYVEVLREDGKPAEEGEVGELIVTDLHNYFMPFLRYRIGDMGALSDMKCKCGIGFPMVKEIEGRSFDLIVTPSGKTLGGFFWTFISRAVPGIKQFQVVQKQKNSVDFKIVPDNNFKKDSTKRLAREIKEKAGQDFHVNFHIVDEIPLTISGKFRFISSEILRERLVMKSKIHKAVVTEINPDQLDSVTIDEELLKLTNLKKYEKVLIVDNINGARLETCILKGKKGSGVVSINGAGSKLIKKGDEIIIMSFAWTDEKINPAVILVNEKNEFVKFL